MKIFSVFSQLFGDADPDDDVAPYEDEEEQKNGNGEHKEEENGAAHAEDQQKAQLNTRAFATKTDYNPLELYTKVNLIGKWLMFII